MRLICLLLRQHGGSLFFFGSGVNALHTRSRGEGRVLGDEGEARSREGGAARRGVEVLVEARFRAFRAFLFFVLEGAGELQISQICCSSIYYRAAPATCRREVFWLESEARRRNDNSRWTRQ